MAVRGSKTLSDYVITDINPMFLPLPTGALSEELCLPASEDAVTDAAAHTESPRSPPRDDDDTNADDDGSSAVSPSVPLRSRGAAAFDGRVDAELSQARFCMMLSASHRPCVHFGCWKAYAGEKGAGSHEGDAPRARVRRAVERLLQRHPDARVVLTGHSLGGALSTLCAYDLLAISEPVRAARHPLTLVNFAAPRMFNTAFQDAMTALVDGGRLHALRVVVGADMIARIPPKQLGAAHGVRARLLLHPEDRKAPASYSEDDVDDKELWRILPADDHVCHALYLGGDTTPGHPLTLPKKFPWPLQGAPSVAKPEGGLSPRRLLSALKSDAGGNGAADPDDDAVDEPSGGGPTIPSPWAKASEVKQR